jgi:hypothetical protein
MQARNNNSLYCLPVSPNCKAEDNGTIYEQGKKNALHSEAKG